MSTRIKDNLAPHVATMHGLWIDERNRGVVVVVPTATCHTPHTLFSRCAISLAATASDDECFKKSIVLCWRRINAVWMLEGEEFIFDWDEKGEYRWTLDDR